MLMFTFFRSQKYDSYDRKHLIYVWLLMVMPVMFTCYIKLHCTLYQVQKASNQFTSKVGIVSRVDVIDNQGSSSFNFNSSSER